MGIDLYGRGRLISETFKGAEGSFPLLTAEYMLHERSRSGISADGSEGARGHVKSELFRFLTKMPSWTESGGKKEGTVNNGILKRRQGAGRSSESETAPEASSHDSRNTHNVVKTGRRSFINEEHSTNGAWGYGENGRSRPRCLEQVCALEMVPEDAFFDCESATCQRMSCRTRQRTARVETAEDRPSRPSERRQKVLTNRKRYSGSFCVLRKWEHQREAGRDREGEQDAPRRP